jgi:DtxR family Mn-dependent transcriptional regulator
VKKESRAVYDVEQAGEEILELLWKLTQEEGLDTVTLERCGLESGDPALLELEALGLVSRRNSALVLTEKGKPRAQRTIRRHRLAERLLADVLDIQGSQAEESACRFEHLLHEGLEEKICILLGHPTHCPHGQPIPPGECCREGRSSELRLVAALAQLRPGQSGTVAYLHADDGAVIRKLMAMGIYPGSELSLLQRRPSFVFRVGHSQFAVDEVMARSIYVRS